MYPRMQHSDSVFSQWQKQKKLRFVYCLFKDILDVEQSQGGKIRHGKITIPAKVCTNRGFSSDLHVYAQTEYLLIFIMIMVAVFACMSLLSSLCFNHRFE